jgi:copper transport protein
MLATSLLPAYAPNASAHAALVRGNPSNNEQLKRSPTRVVLYFSEPVEPRLTEIQVTDDDQSRVDEGDTAFDSNDRTLASVGVERLDPGLYFVKWSNVSTVDGHNLRGSYPFVVLEKDGAFPANVTLDPTAGAESSEGNLLPSNWDSFLKWVALLSLTMAAGAALFLLAVLRPAAAFLDEDDASRVSSAGERWIANMAHVLLPAAFIASTVLIVLAVNRFAVSPGLWSYLTTVPAGKYRLAQLILIVVALGAADVLYLSASRRLRLAGVAAMLGAIAAALLTFSLVSHSATERGKFWSALSDYAHLVAAAAWLGALVVLPPFLRWARREIQPPHRFLLIANVFDRFSVLAVLSVVTILATGAFNGLVEIPNAGAMIDTTYGRVLLAKLSLLAPLLAVAGVNAVFLKPRLVAAIDAAHQPDAPAAPELRDRADRQVAALQRLLPWTIVVETALVFAVFAAVAVLSQSATARGEVAQERALAVASTRFEQTAEEGGLTMTIEVTPNRVGLNEYTLNIRDAGGAAAGTVSQARLRFTYEEPGSSANVPPSELLLTRDASGEYRAAGAYFSQPGNWRIEVAVRRTDADDVQRSFLLPVQRAEQISDSGRGGAFDLPFDTFTWNEVVAVALVVLGGVALLLWRPGWSIPIPPQRKAGAAEQRRVRAQMVAGAVLFVVGAVFFFSVDSHATGDPTAGNPFEPTDASVARGRMLFQQNCIVCHGVDGRGDGPQAASLDPAPTDMRGHIPLHTDPQFYAFIADGYAGTAMPAFRDAFEEEDIWNLVNFLRTEFGEPVVQ